MKVVIVMGPGVAISSRRVETVGTLSFMPDPTHRIRKAWTDEVRRQAIPLALDAQFAKQSTPRATRGHQALHAALPKDGHSRSVLTPLWVAMSRHLSRRRGSMRCGRRLATLCGFDAEPGLERAGLAGKVVAGNSYDVTNPGSALRALCWQCERRRDRNGGGDWKGGELNGGDCCWGGVEACEDLGRGLRGSGMVTVCLCEG
ncbi:hypothetical protein VTK56DRAFT_8979 [Thermocarpiscus australiensis]